ncbi:39S ribosomal protein L48, mitochondrial-like [Dermacentor silvarum]|uniref:39S ribosomal protein L48, mitochondrial-like n=1 Tax=Dermacentor silvarum TaxID=543639 RepID=UPI001898B1C5|nr:39S ribosomal protein L48, mitochondrial-like [Dermacentor silvarum]
MNRTGVSTLLQLTSRALRTPVSSARSIMKYHEPEYLQYLKPPLPVHEGLINVQLKGYDFTVLENNARKVAKIAAMLGIRVSECWATPLESMAISTYKPQSTTVEDTFKLNVYERNIQVSELPGVMAPIFLEAVQLSLAEGVRLSVHRHLPEHEEIRYVPDLELEELQRQLDEIVNPPTSKHVKKQF